jgi:hypothetical protein
MPRASLAQKNAALDGPHFFCVGSPVSARLHCRDMGDCQSVLQGVCVSRVSLSESGPLTRKECDPIEGSHFLP